MNPDNPRELLTAAGAARRRQILAAAFREADRRQRRRTVRRAAVFTCVAGFIGLSLIFIRARTTPSAPAVAINPTTQSAITQTTSRADDRVKPPAVAVEFIPAENINRRWEVIDDDQLLDALADAGQPSGIMRIDGKTVVVPVQ
jgi:hypothetical protein